MSSAQFICPKCNAEVAEPAFVKPKPWWRRHRWESSRPTPYCPRGHKLRSMFVGRTTELTLPWAFLRGFGISCLLLAYGFLQDRRYPHHSDRFCLTCVAALEVGYSLMAFAQAWEWAGRKGPVNRLTARACGMALGLAIPALAVGHALYFGWASVVLRGLYRAFASATSR